MSTCPICNQPIVGVGYPSWDRRKRIRICDECHERKVRQETSTKPPRSDHDDNSVTFSGSDWRDYERKRPS